MLHALGALSINYTVEWSRENRKTVPDSMTFSGMLFILWLSLFRSRVTHSLAVIHIFKGKDEQERNDITLFMTLQLNFLYSGHPQDGVITR